MNRRSFIALLAMTSVMVVLTASVRMMSPDYRVSAGIAAPAFPGFMDAVNSAGSLSIEMGGKMITLSLDGDTWRLPERAGYPVDGRAVREMLLAIAQMKAAEPKTSRVDRYHRIQVEDPIDDTESKSRRIVIGDRDGAVLLDAVFGKTVSAAQGVPDGGVYYRVMGSEQAWLSNGKIDPGVEVEDWIERQIIDLKPERVKSESLRHADGETLRIQRLADGSGKLALLDIPDGYRLVSEFRRDSIAGFLNELTVSDVALLGGLGLSDKLVSETTYETMDGLSVLLTLSGDEDVGHWMQFTVKGGGDTTQEATDISTRVDGWLFRIDDWKAGDLKRRLADLIEPNVSDEGTGTSTGG